MKKKILYHFLFALFSFFLLSTLINKIEKFNPVIKALKELSFSDIYFAYIQEKTSSDDIYIVDVGYENHHNTRVNITNFINEVNSKYKPSVIGVDVFFENEIDKEIDLKLSNSLSENNVIRIFKMIEKSFDENESLIYADFGSLPNLDTNTVEKDGYTFGLGDATEHPCIRYFKPTFIHQKNKYNHFSSLVAEKHMKFIGENFDADLNLNYKMMINYNKDFSSNRININDTSRYHELEGKIVLLGINTYKNDGFPLYNDDVHYTPKNKYYIGRSEKDTYGIEILANIVSNLINSEYLSYKEGVIKYINILLSMLIYIFLLYVFVYLNEFFVFFKILFQTAGVLLLVISSLLVIHFSNFYIDLTLSIAIMFIAAEVVEVVEELLEKINNWLSIKLKK